MCYVNFEFYHVIRIMIYWYLLVPVNRYTYNILYGRMQNFIILFNKIIFFRNCNKNYVIHLLLGWVRNTNYAYFVYQAKYYVVIYIYVEFGVVVIKLRSTRGSNCSSRAELARLESCNYCLKCWVIWLLLPQTPRICITSTVSLVAKIIVICVT